MAIYMAELIRGLGYSVAIISRGYKGQAERIGGVVCDGHIICMGPDTAGDEPVMVARRLKTVPVIVGQNRFKAGKLAIHEFNPDVLLLDDAFQHAKLHRDSLGSRRPCQCARQHSQARKRALVHGVPEPGRGSYGVMPETKLSAAIPVFG